MGWNRLVFRQDADENGGSNDDGASDEACRSGEFIPDEVADEECRNGGYVDKGCDDGCGCVTVCSCHELLPKEACETGSDESDKIAGGGHLPWLKRNGENGE